MIYFLRSFFKKSEAVSCSAIASNTVHLVYRPDLGKPPLASAQKAAQICCGLSKYPPLIHRRLQPLVDLSITVYDVLLIVLGQRVQLDFICWCAGRLWQRRHECSEMNVSWRRMRHSADGCYSWSDWQLGFSFHFWTACCYNVLTVSNMGLNVCFMSPPDGHPDSGAAITVITSMLCAAQQDRIHSLNPLAAY